MAYKMKPFSIDRWNDAKVLLSKNNLLYCKSGKILIEKLLILSYILLHGFLD